MGVAQVIGRKPMLSVLFSSGPDSIAIAVSAPMGRNCEIAASAVPAPTLRRKRRRIASSGNSARTVADSTARCMAESSPRGRAASCSAWLL